MSVDFDVIYAETDKQAEGEILM